MGPKTKEKPKSATLPPIEDLFTSLNRHIENSELELALKISNQVLSIAPEDEDAIRCKVVALIKIDNIEKALSTIQSAHPKFNFTFFKAYCLYRQNKLDESLAILKGQEKDTAAMLLESQILYRIGKIDASLDIYRNLQKSKVDSLEINLVAGLVSAGKGYEVQETLDALRVKPDSNFELAYNTSCAFIQTNKYSDAEQLLLSARRIGQEALMDDNLADDDVENELSPIAVQLAYVWQMLGQSQEAMEAYSGIITRNLADETSLAVAVNNLIASKGPKDVSPGLRKLDKLIQKVDGTQNFQLSGGLDLKLSQKQKESIYINRVLLLLHSNKIEQARELVAALLNMFGDSVIPVLLQAAVLVRENKAGKAEEITWQFSEKYPEKSKMVLLARAQIAAAANHPQIAAQSLLKIPDIQHMPATVATLVSLKERAGDIDGANSVLDSAIQWWSNAMTEDNKLNIIMQEAASFKLKHGRQEDAAGIYEKLIKSSHGGIEALVGLITTTAQVNVEKAEVYEKQLKPLPGLKGVDVDSLEKTSGAKHVESGSLAKQLEANEESKNKDKAKKKRKRKPKYPKGFDPANPGPMPDPERWLPRRERSSYRPKRKDKRAAAQVRGSQGAVVRDKQESTSVNTSSSKANPASSSKGTTQNVVAEPSNKPSSKSSKKKKSRK